MEQQQPKMTSDEILQAGLANGTLSIGDNGEILVLAESGALILMVLHKDLLADLYYMGRITARIAGQ